MRTSSVLMGLLTSFVAFTALYYLAATQTDAEGQLQSDRKLDVVAHAAYQSAMVMTLAPPPFDTGHFLGRALVVLQRVVSALLYVELLRAGMRGPALLTSPA